VRGQKGNAMTKGEEKSAKKGKRKGLLSRAGKAVLELLEESPRKPGENTTNFNKLYKYTKRRHSNDMGGWGKENKQ